MARSVGGLEVRIQHFNYRLSQHMRYRFLPLLILPLYQIMLQLALLCLTINRTSQSYRQPPIQHVISLIEHVLLALIIAAGFFLLFALY